MSKQEETIPETEQKESPKSADLDETGVVLAGEVLPTSLAIMPTKDSFISNLSVGAGWVVFFEVSLLPILIRCSPSIWTRM